MEDEVIKELDVAINTSDFGRLMLVQYPLRPRYRPYGDQGSLQYGEISEDRLRLTYGIDSSSVNYDKHSSDYRCVSHTLDSMKVDPLHTYCVGVIREGELVLTPIQQIFQMRPSMDYVDKQMSSMAISSQEEGELKAYKAATRTKAQVKSEEKPEPKPLVKLDCREIDSDDSRVLMDRLSDHSTDTVMYSDCMPSIINIQTEQKGRLHELRRNPVNIQIEQVLLQLQVVNSEFLWECLQGDYSDLLVEVASTVQARWVCKTELLRNPTEDRDLILACFKESGVLACDKANEISNVFGNCYSTLKELAVKKGEFWELKGYPEEM